ncbi:MAG: DUF3829 domain-containing protein [Myxococcales bacterium]|nr:DUF3829 domain-containing protein [Myxococcales bacterium]
MRSRAFLDRIRPVMAFACCCGLLAAACGKDEPKQKAAQKKQAAASDDDDELEQWERERAEKKAKREADEEAAASKGRGPPAGPALAPKKGDSIPGLTADDVALRGKLNDYSETLARCAPQLKASNDKYRDWADVEKGPTGDEDIVYGVLDAPDLDACQKLVDKGLARKPESFDVDSSATKLKEALDKLYPVLKRAVVYYDAKGWQNDSMEKGKAMHEGLVQGFEMAFAAIVELRPKLEAADRTLAEKELDAVKQKYGKGYRWLYRTQQYRCRVFAGVLALPIAERDAKLLAEALGGCKDAIVGLSAFAGEQKGDVPVNSADTPKWRTFLDAAKAFEQVARQVDEILKKGEPLPDEGDASIGAITSKYSRMQDKSREIDDYF